MKLNNELDERARSQFNKNGCNTSIILLILLFCDFMVKIYFNRSNNEYLSSCIIFFIGIVYFVIKNSIDKIPLMNMKRLREKNGFKFKLYCVSLGVLFLIVADVISKSSINKIIFHIIFNFAWLYAMVCIFEKITKKQ